MVGIGLAASLLLTTTLAHGDSFPFANKKQEDHYRTYAGEVVKCAGLFGRRIRHEKGEDSAGVGMRGATGAGVNARLRACL